MYSYLLFILCTRTTVPICYICPTTTVLYSYLLFILCTRTTVPICYICPTTSVLYSYLLFILCTGTTVSIGDICPTTTVFTILQGVIVCVTSLTSSNTHVCICLKKKRKRLLDQIHEHIIVTVPTFPNEPRSLPVCRNLLKHCGKGRNCSLQAVVFSIRLENFLPFSSNLNLSSVNIFNLEEYKLCRLEKG